MVLEQLLRMRNDREELLRKKFFEVTGIEEEDEHVRVVVHLTDNPELLEVFLQCKLCQYEVFVTSLLPEEPHTWSDKVARMARNAVARFMQHSCGLSQKLVHV